MTKKHFHAIANVLREQMHSATYTDSILTPALTGETIDKVPSSEAFRVTKIAEGLAEQFEFFNPQFNRDYFLAVALGETE